jgi:hypothetical protein
LASSASASALCLLLCSDDFGAPRGTRIGKPDREVGILLGIEIEGASICTEIVGKAVGHDFSPGWRSGPIFANTCILVRAVMESRNCVGLLHSALRRK